MWPSGEILEMTYLFLLANWQYESMHDL